MLERAMLGALPADDGALPSNLLYLVASLFALGGLFVLIKAAWLKKAQASVIRWQLNAIKCGAPKFFVDHSRWQLQFAERMPLWMVRIPGFVLLIAAAAILFVLMAN